MSVAPQTGGRTAKTLAFIGFLLLASFGLTFAPSVEFQGHAWWVMVISSAALSIAFVAFLLRQRDAAEKIQVEINARPTHFMQAIAQSSIYFFVGSYWGGE